MARDKTVEITIAGQVVRFDIQMEAGVYFARPVLVSQRFMLPPAYYGVARSPGKAMEKCKELVEPYVGRLMQSLRP
ncbi:MAG: hypothetical protein U0166_19185 [Acidobacteriota bacterium]